MLASICTLILDSENVGVFRFTAKLLSQWLGEAISILKEPQIFIEVDGSLLPWN